MKDKDSKEKDSIEDLKRANRELLALYDINRLLQTQLPTEEKLYIILTSLTADDAFGYSRAYLLLMNDQKNTLEGWLGVGPLKGDEAREIWEGVTALEEEDTAPGRKNISELLERAPFDIKVRAFVVPVSRGQGHPVQTVISRRPKLLKDIKSGKEPLHPEFEKILSSKQVAFIPMLSKKHVMGVIAVESPGGDRSIDEKRLRTLTVFGNLAAIALENSKLYHDLEEKVSTLERVNRELQDAQAKIMQLDRLASMGAIAAGVAHEIKNPLNSLFINMHLLKEEVRKTQPEVRKLLEVVEMETERLSSTVIEFLNYSKAAEAVPRPVASAPGARFRARDDRIPGDEHGRQHIEGIRPQGVRGAPGREEDGAGFFKYHNQRPSGDAVRRGPDRKNRAEEGFNRLLYPVQGHRAGHTRRLHGQAL